MACKVSFFLRDVRIDPRTFSPRLHCFAAHIVRSDVGFHLMKSPAHIVCTVIIVPDGRSRLARYIGSLSHASNDPLADLKAQFPLMAGNAEKTWQSAITRLSGVQSYQLLTFAESERRLGELLRAKIPEIGKSVDLGALAWRKASASEKAALNQLSQALLLFIGQANPVLRPVAREYQEIATRLARGKRRGITKRLARLENTRQRLAARMSDIDDYMNWFEATQMESGSGVFADYLRAAEQPQAPESRHDPLSVYLDALQDQFEDYQQ